MHRRQIRGAFSFFQILLAPILSPKEDHGVNYTINYTITCLLQFTVSFALDVYLSHF